MKKTIFQAITFALLIITGSAGFQACSSTSKLNTEAPTGSIATAPVYQPKLSSVTVPVSISIAAIEEKLNSQFSGILYKDDKLEGDNVAVTVLKSGRMTMRADRDKIYFSIPLHIYAKGRWKMELCKICPSINKTEDTSFDMVINTESRIGLTEDYKINTITSGDFEWGKTKPVLELGPLKIGLARFVEPKMQEQMNVIAKQLDKELQNRVDLKKYVTDAWLLMQEPIKLDNELNAWLSIVPKEVRMAPIYAKDGNLHTRIGITSYLTATTDGKPQVKQNRNLPKLIIDSRLKDDIQIGLTANIPYEHASRMLQEKVAGKTFNFDKDKSVVKVNTASITASGDQLIMMFDVDGKTKAGLFTKKIVGKVYLRGTPYYDAQSNSIKVRDVDYDLDTKDKLLSTANWFARNTFKEMIQEQVNIPVQGELEKAKQMLQTSLNQSGRVHESLLLQGNIQDIAPENIYLTPTGIKAVINAKGNITATIDKL